jgi:RNA polymerase sigma factor, sigma-70 family
MLDTNGADLETCTFIDERILNELFQKYWNSVYHVCLKYTGSEIDSEELAQDIFFSIWKRRETINVQDISRYLHGAAKLKAFNFMRNKSRAKLEITDLSAEPVDNEHPAIQLEFKELNANFSKFCNTLPDPCREIFLLSRNHAMSHKQISEKMNISLGMVEYHIGTALKRIRKKLHAFL